MPVKRVDFLYCMGQQIDTVLDIGFIGHFNGLVYVTGGYADGSCDGTGFSVPLKARGVCSPGRQDLRLPFDFVLVRRLLQELNHACVADRAGVHDLDAGSFA